MANVQPTLNRTSDAAVASQPSQRDLAFKTFGVMDTGQQSKSSVVTSLVINGIAVLLVIAISLTARKVIADKKALEAVTFVPVPKPEPPPPPPPMKLPRPPVMKTPPLVQPKIELPKIEVPEPPKVQPVIMRAAPNPVPTPPAPKVVSPPPAPQPVALHIAQAAAVPNNDVHPAAIRVGSMTNPINNTTGPAVSAVNLGRSGAPGMSAGNTGLGAPSKVAIAGSGSPNGTTGGHDAGPQPIKGISTGFTGGSGPISTKPPGGAIAIATNNTPPVVLNKPTVSTGAAKTTPKVLFKPKPDYTEEAKQLHLEGTVTVKIHVAASGSVSVVGVQSGLGHGLDQAAVRAVQAMRFQPATENGQPTDWDGVVSIAFQLAG